MGTTCMGCMQPLKDGATTCEHCGYPVGGVNPAEYLQVRTVLNNRYLLGRVLEIGGDSAVYIACDQTDGSVVTVREFFPSGICRRTENGVIAPVVGHEIALQTYRTKFLNVARAVARLRDVLVVVPSFDIFEENGTAYSVSEYCEGISLEKYVAKKGGRLPFDEVRRLFLPLLSALATIHSCGVLHLGISPKNVLVDSEGKLRIKNFAIPETRTVNTECKPYVLTGYAAPEQYEKNVQCTTAADVYGVAATMLFALTGATPTDALQRLKKGEELLLPFDVSKTMPAHVKESLYRALRISAERRTASMQQLLDELTATPAVAALIEEEKQAEEPQKKAMGAGGYFWLIFVSVFLVLVVVAMFFAKELGLFSQKTQATTTSQQNILNTSVTITTTQSVQDMQFLVENVVGKNVYDVQKKVLSGAMKVVIKGYEYSETVAENTILSQSPAADEKADRGTVISVVISAGSSQGRVPNLAGWKEEHARLYLEALGYHVDEQVMLLQKSNYEKGLVDRSVPAAGATVTVGDTIKLYVSDVPSQTVTATQNEQGE